MMFILTGTWFLMFYTHRDRAYNVYTHREMAYDVYTHRDKAYDVYTYRDRVYDVLYSRGQGVWCLYSQGQGVWYLYSQGQGLWCLYSQGQGLWCCFEPSMFRDQPSSNLCILFSREDWPLSVRINSVCEMKNNKLIQPMEKYKKVEENWDTISLSSFNSTLRFTVMPLISLHISITLCGDIIT